MNIVKLVIGLVVAAALVVFGAQNTQSVTFDFLVWETPSVPVVLVVAIAVLLGVVISWLVSIPGRFRGMRRRRELQHQVESQDRVTAASHDTPAAHPEAGHEGP